MEVIFLLGRVLYGGYFLVSGINHFRRSGMMVGYAASRGVPMPKFAVWISGLMILLGGLGIVTGSYVQLSLGLVIVFLVPVSFMMHPYWKESDPTAKMTQWVMFWKNMTMLGAALMMLAIPQPWVYSIL